MKTVLAKKSTKSEAKSTKSEAKSAPKGKAEAKVSPTKGEAKGEAIRQFVGVTVGMCQALELSGIYHGAWEHSKGISDSQFSIAHKNMEAWSSMWTKEKGVAVKGWLVLQARKNLAMQCEKKGSMLRILAVVVQRGIVSKGNWAVCPMSHLESGYGKGNVKFYASHEAAKKECGMLKFPKHYSLD